MGYEQTNDTLQEWGSPGQQAAPCAVGTSPTGKAAPVVLSAAPGTARGPTNYQRWCTIWSIQQLQLQSFMSDMSLHAAIQKNRPADWTVSSASTVSSKNMGTRSTNR